MEVETLKNGMGKEGGNILNDFNKTSLLLFSLIETFIYNKIYKY